MTYGKTCSDFLFKYTLATVGVLTFVLSVYFFLVPTLALAEVCGDWGCMDPDGDGEGTERRVCSEDGSAPFYNEFGGSCTTDGDDGDDDDELTYKTYELSVTKSGSGDGVVAGRGINCGSDCSDSNTTTQNQSSWHLTAYPNSRSSFVEWSKPLVEYNTTCGERHWWGGCKWYYTEEYCGHHEDCLVVVNSGSETVDAEFESDYQTTTRTILNVASVVGTSNDEHPDQGAEILSSLGTLTTNDRHVVYSAPISTTLTPPATHNGGSFNGWSNCNSVSGRNCVVTVNEGTSRPVVVHYYAPTSEPEEPEEPGEQTTLYIRSEPEGAEVADRFGPGLWTTDYTYTTDSAIDLSLYAAHNHANGDSFENWIGCDSVHPDDDNICSVMVPEGGTQTITSHYESPPPPTPTASLSVSPATIDYEDSARITWSSSNADTCTGNGFSTGGATSSSSGVSTGSLTNDTSYSITCSGPGGSDTDTASVNVRPQPVIGDITLTADPQWVRRGGNSTLEWEAEHANSCTLSDPRGGSTTVSGETGSYTATNIENITLFTLDCVNTTSQKEDTITVYVLPVYEEF